MRDNQSNAIYQGRSQEFATGGHKRSLGDGDPGAEPRCGLVAETHSTEQNT